LTALPMWTSYSLWISWISIFRQTDVAYVAETGNNVERNFVLSTKSKQSKHVQFASTLSKGRNFMINSFDIVAVFWQQSRMMLRHCCWCGWGFRVDMCMGMGKNGILWVSWDSHENGNKISHGMGIRW